MQLLLTLLFLSAFSACSQESATQVETNDDNRLSTLPSLTFLVHPYDNPSRLVARFSPLCDYLSKVSGQPVKLVIARSYVDQVQRITKGQVDLAYMGPTPFLRAQDHYLADNVKKIVPFAAEVKGGNASYQSVIVVRDNSDIKDIKDIEDHTFAFGAPHSFSSHYVPRVMLGNNGLAFKNLRDYAYLGRHERVALAVLHGDFDAGGLNRDVAKRYQNRTPGLRVISASAPLPPHLIVARPDFSLIILEQLTLALVEPDTNDSDYNLAMTSLGQGTRFTAPDMQSFDYARRIIKAVESYPAKLESR
ncbi:MAG: phosphate/phosphite/phosphonate ABC transporter substrate-binding protein [Planctomycetia bacterium]|nr:phosphate/phosphite/phosphonate ABC transporter substrate-binding protein [Planctomycetia bacterium]